MLEWRIFERRKTAVLLALAFFLVGAISVHNLVSRNVARAHIDEYLTIFLGTEFLSPWTGAPYSVRVGEMTRWFVRLLYPFGVYYMNSRMGGDWEGEALSLSDTRDAPAEFRSGWQYPGGYYLKEKLRGKDFYFFVSDDFERDPNVQDYVFAIRFAFGLMVILSFSLVIYALCLKINAIASAFYGLLVLSNSVVYGEFAYLYAETVLFFIFNLTMFLYLKAEKITCRLSIWLGILSAAALSTKMMGILIAIPAFLHVLVNRTREDRGKMEDWRFEIYALAFVISLVAINFWSGSLFNFVNETLVNVYNYAGRRNAQDIPLRFFSETVSELGGVFVILYIPIFLWLVSRWRRSLAAVYGLGVVTAAVVWSLSNASIWSGRNVTAVYVAMSFIVALGAGKILENRRQKFRKSAQNFDKTYSAAACVVFLVVTVAVPAIWLPSLDNIFSGKARGVQTRCEDIAALGLSEKDAVHLIGRKDIEVFEIIDRPVTSGADGPSGRSPKWYKTYTDFDCLVVRRRGENKHISNYFAPLTHEMSIRIGNLFFFSPRRITTAKREEAYRAAWSATVDREPAARSNFDVYVDENAVIFIKEPCARRDTRGFFFLRIYPVDERDLPSDRRNDDLLDFIWEQHGARFDGRCMATAPLPAYGVARIRAGQTDGFHTVWEVEIPLSGAAPSQ